MDQTFAKIKHEFLRACTVLNETGDFDEVCQSLPMKDEDLLLPALSYYKSEFSHEQEYENESMLLPRTEYQEDLTGAACGEAAASSASLKYNHEEQCGIMVKNVKICKFFNRSCRNGYRCTYGHVSPEAVSASISHEKVKVRL